MDNISHHDTLPKLLFHNANTRPDATATRAKYRGIWQVKTWRELSEEIRDIAYALASLGFQRGDRITIIGDLDSRLYNVMAAIQCLGGIPVVISAEAGQSQLSDCLAGHEARFAVAEDIDLLDELLSVQNESRLLDTCILLDSRGIELYEQIKVHAYDVLRSIGTRLYTDAPEMLDRELGKGGADDTAVILFDNNSRGESIGIALTHANWINTARTAAQALNFTDRDEVMCWLSPAHAWSFLFYFATPLLAAYRVNFPETHDTILGDMREIGPTFWFASPNAYKQVANLATTKMEDCGWFKRSIYSSVSGNSGPTAGKSSALHNLLRPFAQTLIFNPMKEVLGLTRVRTVVTVSDAVSPEERDFYSALNLNMRKLYGPTAACGMLTLSDDGKVLHADSGRPVGDMELRIGKSRAIEFKGPHAAGPNPAIEPGAPGSVDAEGWCNTGEAGRLDSGARLTLLGAVDDLGVMTDGTEFIPHIVEQNLQASPYIRHAVVFGDRKPFVTALLVLNASTVSAWAERNGVRFTESSVCAELDDIFSLINGQVNQANRRLAAAGYGKLQVKRFAVLRRELDADAGELTLKRQPCRAVIETRHAGLIAALFGDGSEYVVGEAQGEIQESATDKEHVRISSLIPEAESNQPPRVSSGGTPRQVARSGT